MIVLDTHAWIWWVDKKPEKLSERARAAIEVADWIGVSAISAWEVAMLVRLRRIKLDSEATTWITRALAAERLRELPVTANIATQAGALDGEHVPGDPADRIIYATARAHAASIVTKDESLRALDASHTIW